MVKPTRVGGNHNGLHLRQRRVCCEPHRRGEDEHL